MVGARARSQRPAPAGRAAAASPTAATAPRGRASADPYVAAGDRARRPTRSCPTPSCTRTRRSASSTAPRRPSSSSRRRERLGLHALAITDHDGFYGIVRFAEAAETLQREDRVRRRALARAAASRRTASADPEGAHLLVLARRRGGLPPARRRDHRTASSRAARRGARVYDLERARRAARAAHWAVLTGCRKGAVRRALADGGRGCRGARARPARRAVRARRTSYVELIDHGNPLDHATTTTRSPGSPPSAGCRCSRPTTCTTPRPSEHRLAAAVAAVRASRSLDELDGWLPAARRRAPALAAPRWRARFARYPGRRRPHGDARRRARRSRCAARKPALPQAGGAGGPHADVVAARSSCGRRCRASTPTCPTTTASGIETRARRHRAEGLPRLLPDRVRHRAEARQPRHPVPGSRLGRQLGGLLPARHHRGRLDLLRAAVRAVPLRACATRSPTSTSTSTPTGARRSSSGSTASTGANARAGRERHPATGRRTRCATWRRRSGTRPASRTPGRSRSSAGARCSRPGRPRHPRPGRRARRRSC